MLHQRGLKSKQIIVLLFSAAQLWCLCSQKWAVFRIQVSLLKKIKSLCILLISYIPILRLFHSCSPISSLQFSISSCRVSSIFSFKYCSAWICSFKKRISAFSFSSRWSAAVLTLMMSCLYLRISSRSSWIKDSRDVHFAVPQHWAVCTRTQLCCPDIPPLLPARNSSHTGNKTWQDSHLHGFRMLPLPFSLTKSFRFKVREWPWKGWQGLSLLLVLTGQKWVTSPELLNQYSGALLTEHLCAQLESAPWTGWTGPNPHCTDRRAAGRPQVTGFTIHPRPEAAMAQGSHCWLCPSQTYRVEIPITGLCAIWDSFLIKNNIPLRSSHKQCWCWWFQNILPLLLLVEWNLQPAVRTHASCVFLEGFHYLFAVSPILLKPAPLTVSGQPTMQRKA